MTAARRHILAGRALVLSAVVAACLACAPATALAVPPPEPTLTATSPASPADDTSPEIIGTAEALSTVRIYTDPACTGTIAGAGSAGAFASTGITVTVPSSSTTTFYATATNLTMETSACSTSSITYTEAPSAPVVVDTDPPSPSADNAPRFRGTAEAGTTVYLYRDATCAGEFIGVGSAAEFASPGISIIVGDNSSTTIWARVIDGGLTPSACSSTSATYVHELPKPPSPVFTGSTPPSPANDNIPFITGGAIPGGIVRIYANPTCSEPRASESTSEAFASPGIQTSVLNDATTTLYATVTDSRGTASACSTSSLTYVEDSTPPDTAIVAGPAGTVRAGTTVRFEFSASEPGSRFECQLHEPGFRPCASPATFPARPGGSSARNATLQVRAIDLAGNADATPASRTYAIGAAATSPRPPLRTGCPLRVAAISGTPAANTLNGTARSDILLGKAGNDLLRGLAGNDCLYGEAGNDRLRGGSGADRLFGGPGADRLEGESGSDRMSGAAGNDRLTDHSGRDSFFGGSGNDTIDARDVSLAGRRIPDTVSCGPGRDRAFVDRRDRVLRDCERVSRR